MDVDPRGRPRSNAPASVEVDFQQSLREQRAAGTFDEFTIEVHAARQRSDQSQATTRRVPHRLDRLFGTSRARLSFVLPEHTWTNFIVYFDTLESGHGRPDRYPGLVGDGDKFCETYGRREIAASHFDCFVDFDGDGDLNMFKGGVEPFVLSFENVGNNRLVERGRLASDDQVLKLPSSRANRSWLTVAFHDVDRDGDQDFFRVSATVRTRAKSSFTGTVASEAGH